MIVGIVLGAIGLLIAIFSLKCLKMGNMEDNLKATMTLSAGIMLLLAGYFTNNAQMISKKKGFAIIPALILIFFRCLWDCWGVSLCQFDCTKFSVHYICQWIQRYCQCWWTNRNSDAKVKINWNLHIYSNILPAELILVMFNLNNLSGILLALHFSWVGSVALSCSSAASWCAWPAVQWLQRTTGNLWLFVIFKKIGRDSSLSVPEQ